MVESPENSPAHAPLRRLTRIADKAGSLGAVISAMGCAMCFPAIAGIGAAVGLGFLSQ
jgi:mercuric ion transport protein